MGYLHSRHEFFNDLRFHNVKRCNTKYKHGIDAWSVTDWGCAMAGEAGELCNLLKKMRRGEDIPLKAVADEIADVVIYLDLLCAKLDINLPRAIADKFNEVSKRVGYEPEIF